MNDFTVGRYLVPVKHTVIPDNIHDPKMIIPEYATPTFGLSHAVNLGVSPLLHGFFISPEGEGKNFFRIIQTLVTLDRNKSINFRQFFF
jgi:hypothetical protein